MSVGLQFIRSVIERGAQTALRQAHAAWFDETELPVYEHVLRHASVHGQLPSLETLNEQGIRLTRASEPPAYYSERLVSRAVFLQLEGLHPDFLQAVKTRDMNLARNTLRDMLANSQSVNVSSDITSVRDQGLRVIEEYERASRSFRLLGCSLGWDVLDDATDGGQPGDIIVVVGRPSVGKTYSLLWMLRRAWLAGASILLCSMEMDPEQITRRIIGIQSGVNPRYIRSGRLSRWGENLMRNTVSDFDDLPPLEILAGNFRKRVGDINRAAEELQPDLIVVDAGYLVGSDKTKGRQTRRENIADVIEELKGVAIDRRRPLLTSVQFNRQVRKVHRGALDLGDIGETDVIAQVATIVLGLRYADAPHALTRRRFELLKNRDGALLNFETSFGFAPVDFSFLRMLVEDDAQNAASAPDLRSMV